MGETTTETTTPYKGLFDQTSEEAQRMLHPVNGIEGPLQLSDKVKYPVLDSRKEASEADQLNFNRTLRLFYTGNQSGQKKDLEGLLPAAFTPFIGKDHVEDGYPLFIGNGRHSMLKDLLTDLAELQSGDAHFALLQRFIPALVKHVREVMGTTELMSLKEAVSKGFQAFRDKLEMGKDDRKNLMVMLGELERSLPEEGVLVPFGEHTPYLLLNYALVFDNGARAEMFSKATAMLSDMQGLYDTELAKRNGGGKAADTSLGFAQNMVDLDAFASVTPAPATEPMSDERFNRISTIIGNLEKAESVLSEYAHIVIEAKLAENIGTDPKDIFTNIDITLAQTGKACNEGVKVFEKNMTGITSLVSSMRQAELELAEGYVAENHDPYFDTFSWRQFTDVEMAACPITAVLISSTQLVKTELTEFSDLLSRNLPVRILAIQSEDDGLDDTKEMRVRQELASIAIAHRNTYVHQSVLIDPDASLNGMLDGLYQLSPSLFHLLLPESDNAVSAHLWSSAAVESRAFPSLSYVAQDEKRWGSRWNIAANPQIDSLWPEHQLQLSENQVLDLQFTYADFLTLDNSCRSEFMKVDAGFWSDGLLPVAEFLNLSEEERSSKIPFVWMVSEELVLYKVAVSRKVAMACLERIDHWQYLQDNSGVHNYHAEHAAMLLEQKLKQEAQQRIDELNQQHEAELEKVREETTDQAMEQLTSMLLNLNPADMVAAPQAPAVAKPVETAAPAAHTETEQTTSAPVAEEEDDMGAVEPWIETSLCTACDECTDINGKMFNYNTEKLAFVADAKAGTFAELVNAATNCPVGIIHPGTPINKNEPGLEALIAKAAKFN